MSEDFTFGNVRLLTQAVANYLKKNKLSRKGIMIGHDTRFFSPEFAKEAAKVITSNDIDVYMADKATPTPAISFSVLNKKLAGAIIISASHNAAEYNGFKFSSEDGGPSSKEVTEMIENEVAEISEKDIRLDDKKFLKRVKRFNPAPAYLKNLKKVLDVKILKKSKLKIAVDCMNGIVSGYLDKILKDLNFKVELINEIRDPLFNGRDPDPSPENLKDLIRVVKKGKFDLGLAVDGDADRFGIIDRGGEFIIPNKIISLLFYHLINTRTFLPQVARSASTTHLVDKIAKDYGLEVVETPVGFKYISQVLKTGKCLFGAEESGGLSVAGHIPEKDGILANLLVIEAMASTKKPIKMMLEDIYKIYGKFYNERIYLRVTETSKRRFMERLSSRPPKKIAQKKVTEINRKDGYKFILEDDSWVMFRLSGTEPLIRCYIESRTKEDLSKIKKEVMKIIG